VLLALASVTDSFVHLATHVIKDLGYAGVFVMTMTSGVIGVPGSEPTMLFAGFGVLGDVAGGSIAYGIGRFGRHELLERQGSKLHMSSKRLERAHSWFERYGSPVIFFSRMIPLGRAAFPYAAGIAEMSYAKFLAFATAGSIFWISGLALLGREVGSSWPSWRKNLEYVDYAVLVLVVAAIGYFVFRRVRRRPAPNVAS
jgi:membrane protein DedA with SNARE-associated domain